MTTDPRRLQVLESIGIGPVWVRRAQASLQPQAADNTVAALPTPVEVQPTLQASAAVSRRADRIPAFDEIDMTADVAADMPVTTPVAVPMPVLRSPADMNWTELQQAVSVCTLCDLCRTRTRTVFGVGDARAKWLFIGEGPGRNEDLQGEPFVGPAGKLLDNMLAAMQLKRGENAFIANIVKCRPTDADGRDRAPNEVEIAACLPYLQRQIALIQPTILVALGKTAALALLGLDGKTPVASLRGEVHQYQDLPLVVTYHPAYLLRQPGDKGKVWADLCLAMTTYAA